MQSTVVAYRISVKLANDYLPSANSCQNISREVEVLE